MTVDPEQAAGQRKAIALVTAFQAADHELIADQLTTLVAANDLLEVVVALASAYVGMLRATADAIGVEPEFLIRQAALHWQDPPA